MKNKVLEEVKHTFRPEFLNRVDEVVVFHQLTPRADRGDRRARTRERSCARSGRKRWTSRSPKTAKALLAKKGWDPQFGARPLRRAIQREVEDELAEEMLKGNFGAGDHILAEVESGRSRQAELLEDSVGRAARRAAAGVDGRVTGSARLS